MPIDRSKEPAIKQIGSFSLPKLKQIRLDNGIPVYVLNTGDQQVTKLDLIMKGGRCDETAFMESNVTASLLSEGAAGRSGKEIAENLDYYGAWFGANASLHHVSAKLFSTNRHFREVIPVFRDMIWQPTFPEKELGNIKTLSAQRLATNLEKVDYMANAEFSRQFYGDSHPLGNMPDVSKIEGITRESVKEFHDKWFGADNATLLISGIVTDEILHELNRYWGQPWRNAAAHDSASDSPHAEYRPATTVVHKQGAMQSAVKMTLPAILRTHPDYLPLRILVTAFGGYFGSRLMTNIREDKGYTYGISASLLGMLDHSFITVSSQCDNSYTRAVVDEIGKEMELLRQEPIGTEELERLKSYMLCDLARTLDTPFSIAEYYTTMIAYRFPESYFDDQVKTLQQITPEKLLEMAQKYLDPEQALTVLAGDKDIIG